MTVRTVRSDLAEIIAGAPGETPDAIVGRVMDYFRDFDGFARAGCGMRVRRGVMVSVSRRRDGWTADQIARLVIRVFHDAGILDVNSGVLDDDPEMIEDLAETLSIPA